MSSSLKEIVFKWWSEQLLQQIWSQPTINIGDVLLEPVGLSMAAIKHISA